MGLRDILRYKGWYEDRNPRRRWMQFQQFSAGDPWYESLSEEDKYDVAQQAVYGDFQPIEGPEEVPWYQQLADFVMPAESPQEKFFGHYIPEAGRANLGLLTTPLETATGLPADIVERAGGTPPQFLERVRDYGRLPSAYMEHLTEGYKPYENDVADFFGQLGAGAALALGGGGISRLAGGRLPFTAGFPGVAPIMGTEMALSNMGVPRLASQAIAFAGLPAIHAMSQGAPLEDIGKTAASGAAMLGLFRGAEALNLPSLVRSPAIGAGAGGLTYAETGDPLEAIKSGVTMAALDVASQPARGSLEWALRQQRAGSKMRMKPQEAYDLLVEARGVSPELADQLEGILDIEGGRPGWFDAGLRATPARTVTGWEGLVNQLGGLEPAVDALGERALPMLAEVELARSVQAGQPISRTEADRRARVQLGVMNEARGQRARAVEDALRPPGEPGVPALPAEAETTRVSREADEALREIETLREGDAEKAVEDFVGQTLFDLVNARDAYLEARRQYGNEEAVRKAVGESAYQKMVEAYEALGGEKPLSAEEMKRALGEAQARQRDASTRADTERMQSAVEGLKAGTIMPPGEARAELGREKALADRLEADRQYMAERSQAAKGVRDAIEEALLATAKPGQAAKPLTAHEIAKAIGRPVAEVEAILRAGVMGGRVVQATKKSPNAATRWVARKGTTPREGQLAPKRPETWVPESANKVPVPPTAPTEPKPGAPAAPAAEPVPVDPEARTHVVTPKMADLIRKSYTAEELAARGIVIGGSPDKPVLQGNWRELDRMVDELTGKYPVAPRRPAGRGKGGPRGIAAARAADKGTTPASILRGAIRPPRVGVEFEVPTGTARGKTRRKGQIPEEFDDPRLKRFWAPEGKEQMKWSDAVQMGIDNGWWATEAEAIEYLKTARAEGEAVSELRRNAQERRAGEEFDKEQGVARPAAGDVRLAGQLARKLTGPNPAAGGREFQVGDLVRVPGMRRPQIVTQVAEDGKTLKVQDPQVKSEEAPETTVDAAKAERLGPAQEEDVKWSVREERAPEREEEKKSAGPAAPSPQPPAEAPTARPTAGPRRPSRAEVLIQLHKVMPGVFTDARLDADGNIVLKARNGKEITWVAKDALDIDAKARAKWLKEHPDASEADLVAAGMTRRDVDGNILVYLTDYGLRTGGQTLVHESLHVARMLGLVTKAEWELLKRRYAKDIKRGDYETADKYEEAIEERIAEKAEGQRGDPYKGTLVEKLHDRLAELGAWAQRIGVKTGFYSGKPMPVFDELVRRIRTGQILEGEAGKAAAKESISYSLRRKKGEETGYLPGLKPEGVAEQPALFGAKEAQLEPVAKPTAPTAPPVSRAEREGRLFEGEERAAQREGVERRMTEEEQRTGQQRIPTSTRNEAAIDAIGKLHSEWRRKYPEGTEQSWREFLDANRHRIPERQTVDKMSVRGGEPMEGVTKEEVAAAEDLRKGLRRGISDSFSKKFMGKSADDLYKEAAEDKKRHSFRLLSEPELKEISDKIERDGPEAVSFWDYVAATKPLVPAIELDGKVFKGPPGGLHAHAALEADNAGVDFSAVKEYRDGFVNRKTGEFLTRQEALERGYAAEAYMARAEALGDYIAELRRAMAEGKELSPRNTLSALSGMGNGLSQELLERQTPKEELVNRFNAAFMGPRGVVVPVGKLEQHKREMLDYVEQRRAEDALPEQKTPGQEAVLEQVVATQDLQRASRARYDMEFRAKEKRLDESANPAEGDAQDLDTTPKKVTAPDKASIRVKDITDEAWKDLRDKVGAAVGGGRTVFEDLMHVFAPTVGAKRDVLDLAHRMLGERYRTEFVIDAAIDGVRRKFDKMSRDERIEVFAELESGRLNKDPEIAQFQKFARETLDSLRDQAKAFKPDWEAIIANYFPHIWKVLPGGGKKTWVGASRRPLEGSERWAKKRTFETIADGLREGGELWSDNPADVLMHHAGDIMKFISANRMFEAMKSSGMVKMVRRGRNAPDGWVRLDDRIAKLTTGGPNWAEYYFQPDAGRLLKNYLSRDLIRESALGKGIMGLKNLTTQVELGLSGFHAMFEALELMGSRIGSGFRKMVNVKDFWGGVRDIATAPAAPYTEYKAGKAFVKYAANKAEFLKTEEGQWFIKTYPEADTLVEDLFRGGGKLKMHEDYRSGWRAGFRKALADGNYIGALPRSVMAGIEGFTAPLFEKLIPRWKVGMWAREYQLALREKAGALARGDKTRGEVARETWKFIEDRLGEMNFDALWWDRTFKTSAQMMFRSVTWKLGNLRAFGKTLPREAKALRDYAKNHDNPALDQHLAWLMGMSVITTAIGWTVTKMFTGEDPKDIKDLVFPRIDPEDDTQRISTPTYWKDVVHLSHGPWPYVRSSLSGFISKLAEDWNNQDFYGTQIADPDDPLPKRMWDYTTNVMPLPISFQSFARLWDEGKKGVAFGSFAGLTKAPGYVSLTPAQRMMREMLSEKQAKGGRTKEEAEKREQVYEAIQELRRGRTPQKPALLTETEWRKLLKTTQQDPDINRFKRLTIPEAVKVWNEMEEDERKRVNRVFMMKLDNRARTGVPPTELRRLQKAYRAIYGGHDVVWH